MNNNHVSFDKLNELIDGQIPSGDEQSSIVEHINNCAECKLEYDRLKKTISLISQYDTPDFITVNFSARVLSAYKKRRRNKVFFKALPAAAAAIAVIISAAIFQGIPGKEDPGIVALKSSSSKSPIGQLNDILNRNHASIVKVTDLYTECDINLSSFDKIRRDLGFRKVTYHVIQPELNTKAPSHWRHLEEVGIGNTTVSDSQGDDDPVSAEKIVRFRVYR